MIRQPITSRQRTAIGLLAIVLVVAVYTGLMLRQKHRFPNDTTMPNATQFAEGFKKAFQEDEFEGERWIIMDSVATGRRVLLGMLIGCVIAVVLGVLMGSYPRVSAFCETLLVPISSLPVTALIAPFFVVFSPGETMFVAMIAFVVIPMLALSISLAVKDIPDEYIDRTYTYGATSAENIMDTIVPTVLPKIIDGVRIQMALAFIAIIAAEWIIADVGIGFRLRIMMRQMHMNVIFIYLAELGLVTYLLNRGLLWLRRKLCPWYLPQGGE